MNRQASPAEDYFTLLAKSRQSKLSAKVNELIDLINKQIRSGDTKTAISSLDSLQSIVYNLCRLIEQYRESEAKSATEVFLLRSQNLELAKLAGVDDNDPQFRKFAGEAEQRLSEFFTAAISSLDPVGN